ncbi:hypothetical protein BY458DRAFT_509569 [Sporodiniella umbellata]|nr:hypothetical protein BY458DRAFT_509569 [Sporodiniella umbellata]
MSLHTPIIKLPKRNPSKKVRPCEIYEPDDCLVSDTLFLGRLPKNVRESDIRTLLQHCMPTEIIMDREKNVGELIFSHEKYADRAYSLYNGFTFTNDEKLELQMYQDRRLDPEATASLFEVNGLPEYFDDNKLYDLFRPFGPLNLCKCVTLEGQFKGTAFIQFFRQESSDEAQNNLDQRLVDGCKIYITTYLPSQKSQAQQKNEASLRENSVFDEMNLYIKNLHPNINNTGLCNIFRDFGNIVSARVITHPTTGQSKGYGFVSFSKAESAAKALREMNGYIIEDKPLIVSYHEPKKGKLNSNFSGQLQPQPQPHQQYQPYTESFIPRQNASGLGIKRMDGLGTVESMSDLSVGQKSIRSKPSSPATKNTPKLADLALGASTKHTHSGRIQTESRSTPSRRDSFESVMTESSVSVQRAKLESAIKQCGDYGELVDDIVSMLVTLRRREKSLCLFNRDFLKDKINAALEALAICKEEEELSSSQEVQCSAKQNRLSVLSSRGKIYQDASNTAPQTLSRAIPIVVPNSTPSSPLSNKTKTCYNRNEIETLIASFEGKTSNESKQLLGDKLFPLVKALGMKKASKATIRLLDTVDLYELAEIMFDTPLLKQQVEKVLDSLNK